MTYWRGWVRYFIGCQHLALNGAAAKFSFKIGFASWLLGWRGQAVPCRAGEVPHLWWAQEEAACLPENYWPAVGHICHEFQSPVGGGGKRWGQRGRARTHWSWGTKPTSWHKWVRITDEHVMSYPRDAGCVDGGKRCLLWKQAGNWNFLSLSCLIIFSFHVVFPLLICLSQHYVIECLLSMI